ncbi:MAG: hypothetical protein ACRDRL_32075 [Sciscionella sp.]
MSADAPPASVAWFVAATEHDLAAGEPPVLSNEDLATVMTAASRLYAARAEGAASPPPPVNVGALSTTAVLTVACEMLRLTNVNMFDVSMWFARTER